MIQYAVQLGMDHKRISAGMRAGVRSNAVLPIASRRTQDADVYLLFLGQRRARQRRVGHSGYSEWDASNDGRDSRPCWLAADGAVLA